MGTSVKYSVASWDADQPRAALATGAGPSCVRGFRLRIRQDWCLATPDQGVHNPASSTATRNADQKPADDSAGRTRSFRSNLRRAALSIQKSLAGQEWLLLHVWLSDCGQYHMGGSHHGGHRGRGVLPIVRRGKTPDQSYIAAGRDTDAE